jgi:hypothetical protein
VKWNNAKREFATPAHAAPQPGRNSLTLLFRETELFRFRLCCNFERGDLYWFRVREMQAAPAGNMDAGNLIWHDRPFVVHIALDCAAGEVSSPQPVRCQVTIHARGFENEVYQTLGEVQQQLTIDRPSNISIPSAPLTRGLYRLDALVSFAGSQHPQLFSSKMLHVC